MLIIGVIRARLDHVQVGRTQAAPHHVDPRERFAEGDDFRFRQPQPEVTQQESVGDDDCFKRAQRRQKLLEALFRNPRAGFQRKRDVRAVVVSDREFAAISQQHGHSRQGPRMIAQRRSRQQRYRCGRRLRGRTDCVLAHLFLE